MGEELELENIEPQLRRNRINLAEEMKLDFVKEILNSFRAEVNIKDYDVVFTGGGSLVLKDVIDKISNVSIHNDPIYSNLRGAEIIAKELLKI